MSKRFTDTEKWKKPFIRGLNAPYKLLWLYILDDCDFAGIWQVDFDVALLKVGVKVSYNEALTMFGDKITVLEEFKWIINDFIPFQYGTLNPANRVHASIIRTIQSAKQKVEKTVNGASNAPLDRAKDKEQDKEQDIEGLPRGDFSESADQKPKNKELPNWLKGKNQNGQA